MYITGGRDAIRQRTIGCDEGNAGNRWPVAGSHVEKRNTCLLKSNDMADSPLDSYASELAKNRQDRWVGVCPAVYDER